MPDPAPFSGSDLPPLRSGVFDCLVIGGGVVGCATARSLAIRGLSVLLVEAAPDLLEGASKANSAILHTGFDAMPDSVEHALVQQGYRTYRRIHARMNLPLLETGAVVVAWTKSDLDMLPGILAKAHHNGVGDVSVLSRAALLEREPGLSEAAEGAVLVPGEAVIDPWSSPLAYVRQALAHGAELSLGTAVVGGVRQAGEWRIATTAGTVAARVVVNCAGLNADRIEAICRPSPFAMRPRKGQFVVLDKSASALVGAIVLRVPTERTKGILLARTVFGNLLLGPTAEETQDRRRAPVDGAVLAELLQAGAAMVPDLPQHAVTASYAGLRPATEHLDYQLWHDAGQGWITLAGIRSTGLTAALGLGEWAAAKAAAILSRPEDAPPDDALDWPVMPNLSEVAPRPYQQAERGEIVCHCEWVTEPEIRRACEGAVPAGTIGGLKRRTRAMMGRCQGFNCMGKVVRIAGPLGRAGEMHPSA